MDGFYYDLEAFSNELRDNSFRASKIDYYRTEKGLFKINCLKIQTLFECEYKYVHFLHDIKGCLQIKD